MRLIFYLSLLTLTLVSCSDPNRVFDDNLDFDKKYWVVDETVEFDFEIADISQSYNLFYNVRNSNSYPYHNLYVRYSLEDTVGNVLDTKLQNMDLFDPVSGKPLGDGLGDIFDHRILALQDYRFERNGTYRFKIQQFMRQDTLPMILSVGLRVEYAQAQ